MTSLKKVRKARIEKEKPLNKTLKTRKYSLKVKPSEMTSLSNFRWQKRKKRPNRSSINKDMDEIAQCIGSESLTFFYL